LWGGGEQVSATDGEQLTEWRIYVFAPQPLNPRGSDDKTRKRKHKINKRTWIEGEKMNIDTVLHSDYCNCKIVSIKTEYFGPKHCNFYYKNHLYKNQK